MKRKVTIKPRDLNVPAMLKRSSGAHGKTYKAMRRSVKIELAKRLPDVQMGSELVAIFLSILTDQDLDL